MAKTGAMARSVAASSELERLGALAEQHDPRQRFTQIGAVDAEDRLVGKKRRLGGSQDFGGISGAEMKHAVAAEDLQHAAAHRLGQRRFAGDGVFHVRAKLEIGIRPGQPDGHVGVADLAENPVHGMAEHLFEIVGTEHDAAERFGGSDQIELAGEIAVGGDEIVAEEIDLSGDEPAGVVETPHGQAKAVDAALILVPLGVAMQGGADAAEQFVHGEGLGEKIDRAVPQRRYRRLHAGQARDHHGAGQGMMFAQGGQEFGAVAVGEVQIHDQQIDGLGFDDPRRRGKVRRGNQAAIDVAPRASLSSSIMSNSSSTTRTRGEADRSV